MIMVLPQFFGNIVPLCNVKIIIFANTSDMFRNTMLWFCLKPLGNTENCANIKRDLKIEFKPLTCRGCPVSVGQQVRPPWTPDVQQLHCCLVCVVVLLGCRSCLSDASPYWIPEPILSGSNSPETEPRIKTYSKVHPLGFKPVLYILSSVRCLYSILTFAQTADTSRPRSAS